LLYQWFAPRLLWLSFCLSHQSGPPIRKREIGHFTSHAGTLKRKMRICVKSPIRCSCSEVVHLAGTWRLTAQPWARLIANRDL
jgi:hypothetical protein